MDTEAMDEAPFTPEEAREMVAEWQAERAAYLLVGPRTPESDQWFEEELKDRETILAEVLGETQ